MTEDLWIKIGTKGKRGRAKKIICSVCKKEILVRIKQKHSGICRECNVKRPKIKEGELYIEWKGIRYRARKINCNNCNKEILVPQSRPHCGYCAKCNTKRLSDYTRIKTGELFVKHGSEKARARIEKCSRCGKERLVRNDTKNKTTFCFNCALSENGKKAGKRSPEWNTTYGRNLYRRIAFKYLEKKCAVCGSLNKPEVHHIDCNDKNNDISNLIPLCRSCHKSVHWRIRKGLSHNEAIEKVKEKKQKK